MFINKNKHSELRNVFKKEKEHEILKNTLLQHNMYYLVYFTYKIKEHTETAIDNFF